MASQASRRCWRPSLVRPRLSRLQLPPTAEDILGSSALTDPDGLGVYLIRACGYLTPSYPIPGVSLGGLAPSAYPIPVTDLNKSSTPIFGGLPLTKDDFRTHRAPMPPMQTIGSTTHPFVAPTKNRVCRTQLITSIRLLGLTVLGKSEAERRSWQATPCYARIIARTPALDLPRSPLQRLLRRPRFARRRLCARPS